MTGVKLRPNDVSHQMIEECMVAANEAVATELKLRGIPILSRLHEPPDPLKIDELSAALLQLGFHPGDLTDPRNLTRFLGSTIDHPLRDNAHTLVLRSMKRAIYSAELAGHFGLAKRFYSHFTSPIRRYPDLVLHRQLAEHLAKSPKRSGIDLGYLKVTAAKCTEREQQADDASRALIEIKKYRFLQQQIDDRKLIAYEAVISRVTNFGLFVDVTPLQVGGLIHISSISQEFVRFDRETESLSAEGQSFKLGGKVKVVVARVDFTQRRADFTLVRDLAAAPDKAGAGVRKSARPKTPRGDGGRSDRGGSGSQPRGQDGRQSAQPRRQDGPRPAAQPRGQGPGAAKKTTEGAPASPREGKRRGDPRSDFTTQRQRSR
jgi:ribonuclease R